MVNTEEKQKKYGEKQNVQKNIYDKWREKNMEGRTLTLDNLFQSGMVLQRRKPVKIWGTSREEQKVTVRLNQRIILEEKVGKGNFSLFLPPQEGMEDATLEIGDTILERVDFGEVWIAGGQSNMEFPLENDQNGEEMIREAEDSHFRMYTVERYSYPGEKESCEEENRYWNRWLSYEAPACRNFSAVAVYFALELRKMGVPVGILNCNWGGTTASTWLDADLLQGKLAIYRKEYEEVLSKLDRRKYEEDNRFIRRGRGTAEMKRIEAQYPERRKEALVMGPWHENRPGGLYEMMVKQLIGYTIQGVIWYQGESDDKKPELYGELFRKVILCWRRDWEEELPFLFVQLAPFDSNGSCKGDRYPILRKQQELVSKTVPKTYMASIGDAGEEDNIHPRQKEAVGMRLAAIARNRIYGQYEVIWKAPECVKAICEKNMLYLEFDQNIFLYGERLNGLELWQRDEIQKLETVIIQDRTLLARFERKEATGIVVKFAQTGYYEINLYNSAGIPAFPFERYVEEK